MNLEEIRKKKQFDREKQQRDHERNLARHNNNLEHLINGRKMDTESNLRRTLYGTTRENTFENNDYEYDGFSFESGAIALCDTPSPKGPVDESINVDLRTVYVNKIQEVVKEKIVYVDRIKETPVEVIRLVKDSEEMEKAYQCPICLENAINIVFGCGHGTCLNCSSSLEKCHMCRKRITQRTKMFI